MKNLFMASSLVLLAACAGPTQLTNGPQVPGAQGTIDAKNGANGNTEVSVRVKHLAEPGKVAPDATTYVVWVKAKTDGTAPTNLGALKVDKDEEGELTTVTALKEFDVMVTPEPSATGTAPTHEPVLSATVNKR